MVRDDDLDRGYDRNWTVPVGTASRWRFGYSHESGTVTRFAIQLEYSLDEKWVPVVRYDHDQVTDHGGHDVTEEGLRMDVYRDGEKLRQEYIAPPMPAGVALDFAEDHLRENMQRFIRRFEGWHGTKSQ